VGQPFSQTFTVSGGTGPYTWSAGALPAGLSGQSSGSAFSVTGTPVRAGSTVSSVSVADGSQPQQSLSEQVTITITAPDDWQVQGPPALPDGTVGAFYNAGDAVTGDANVRWSATGLPRGLSIDPSTGAISGTPSRAGSYTVNVSATDEATGVTRSAGGQSLTIGDGAAFSPSPTSS
jgi:Putative Ig domain